MVGYTSKCLIIYRYLNSHEIISVSSIDSYNHISVSWSWLFGSTIVWLSEWVIICLFEHCWTVSLTDQFVCLLFTSKYNWSARMLMVKCLGWLVDWLIHSLAGWFLAWYTRLVYLILDKFLIWSALIVYSWLVGWLLIDWLIPWLLNWLGKQKRHLCMLVIINETREASVVQW